MRFLMKIALREEDARDPGINEILKELAREVGAGAAYATQEGGRRIDWMMVDIPPARITPLAEIVFRRLKVKTEFLPEVAPAPYFGHRG